MPENLVRIRRFVRVLLRAGRATCDEDSFVADNGTARARLPSGEVAVLASQGVVTAAKGCCVPTSAAKSWLKRQQAGPDGHADQHRLVVPGPDGSRRDLERDPLAKLAHAAGDGFLQAHHLETGRRVARWGERAQLRQRVTMSYDPAQVGGRRRGSGDEIGDMAVDARKSLAQIYAELPRDCAETIIDVCVFEKGLQTIETERRWPRRSAKLVLRIGLDQLADRLGLMPSASGREKSILRAAMGEGFAPTRFE